MVEFTDSSVELVYDVFIHFREICHMRGYAWNNMYLSSIQQGIQGWHANNEVFNKYKLTSEEVKTFLKWNRSHKTLIVLNGGYADNVTRIHDTLELLAKRFRKDTRVHSHAGVKAIPVTLFREEQASLNGSVTSVFTVLPEACFASASERGPLRRELGRAGVEDYLEASLSKSKVVSAAVESALGYDNAAARFKLATLFGDMAR